MTTRLLFNPHAATVSCEQCGYGTLRVAYLVRDDGTVISHVMVCTFCRQHRRDEDREPAVDGRQNIG